MSKNNKNCDNYFFLNFIIIFIIIYLYIEYIIYIYFREILLLIKW